MVRQCLTPHGWHLRWAARRNLLLPAVWSMLPHPTEAASCTTPTIPATRSLSQTQMEAIPDEHSWKSLEAHCHYLVWSPDSRYIYFVKGVPTTAEMDIWRVSASATAGPERITYHNARVAYPAWLDDHTVIYSATAEDGSGQWLYT